MIILNLQRVTWYTGKVVEYLEIIHKDFKDTGKNGVGDSYRLADPIKHSILGATAMAGV